MRKSFLRNLSILSLVAITVFQSCKDDGELTADPVVTNQSFVEEFDTTAAALSRGWVFRNTSEQRGPGVWQDGGELNPWFRAYSNQGSKAGFIGADFTSTSAAAATISNWLISPAVTIQNGDKIIFYTRSVTYYDATLLDTTDYGNRLRVCVNTFGDDLTVGEGVGYGNYTPLYDINPNLLYSSAKTPLANAYPTQWTRFEVPVTGMPKATKARFAFQYLVEGGGSNGNGSGVAIDKVSFVSISK